MLLTQEARLDRPGNTPSDFSITVQFTALLSSYKTSTTSPQSSQVNPPHTSSFNSTRGGRGHFRGRGCGHGYGGCGCRFSYHPRPSYVLESSAHHPLLQLNVNFVIKWDILLRDLRTWKFLHQCHSDHPLDPFYSNDTNESNYHALSVVHTSPSL
ncbi:hypothetical protein TSUD_179690 [Trifolium subterraneum]|uniref:Uncharacterized protein n=1 Tax=Trifolium subterraneum TaxID=3900 RepID=A0A2Z6NHA1_TRISU|nr:hypothetical protein TSUD_179690 [Trifolium subterraneum]